MLYLTPPLPQTQKPSPFLLLPVFASWSFTMQDTCISLRFLRTVQLYALPSCLFYFSLSCYSVFFFFFLLPSFLSSLFPLFFVLSNIIIYLLAIFKFTVQYSYLYSPSIYQIPISYLLCITRSPYLAAFCFLALFMWELNPKPYICEAYALPLTHNSNLRILLISPSSLSLAITTLLSAFLILLLLISHSDCIQ